MPGLQKEHGRHNENIRTRDRGASYNTTGGGMGETIRQRQSDSNVQDTSRKSGKRRNK